MKELLGGRMNRAVFWLCIAVLIAMTVLIQVVFHDRTPISEIMLILIGVPRLHDMGRSGWWMIAVLAIEAVGLIVVLNLAPMALAPIGLGLTTLMLFAAMAVLGLIPGQPYENRFGTPPAPGLGGRRKV